MSKKKSKLQQAQDEAQAAINETNKKIEELGKHSNNLCIELNNIQTLFDEIRNIPSEKKIECEKLKKIRDNGGRTIGQNKDSCVVYGMPRVAFEMGAVEFVEELEKIPDRILNLLKQNGWEE